MNHSLFLGSLLLIVSGSALGAQREPASMRALDELDASVVGQSSRLPFDASHAFTPDRIHYDSPGDGRLWARGATYKASFGAEGATYIPFLGSDAPRNYPVTMRLESATLGGQPLALSEHASWSRSADVVTLERGEVDLRYHLGVDAIEQTFVLDRLPLEGELVVQLAVDTELEMLSSASGFRFDGALGGVHYGSATVLDGSGRSLALESRLESGKITIRVPSEFLATARLPVIVDPLISTYTVSNSPTMTWAGDLAFDATHGLFLHAYTLLFSNTDNDVFGLMIDEEGNIQWNLARYIDVTDASWSDPSVANNNEANTFAVACRVMVNNVSQVWSRSWPLPGTNLGAQRRLNSGPIFCGAPSIGGDSNLGGQSYFCVVWSELLGAGDSAIRYRFLRSDGTLGTTILTIGSSVNFLDPSVHVSKTNGTDVGINRCWNVVWENDASPGDTDIHAAQIGTDASLVTPAFALDSTPTNHHNPSVSAPLVTAAGGVPDFLAVYEAELGSQSDLHARLFKRDHYVASFDLSALEAAQIGAQHLGHDQRNPNVCTAGTQFVVAYDESVGGEYEVFISSFAHLGAELFLTETLVPISSGVGRHRVPRIASAADAGLLGSRSVAVGWVRSVSVGPDTESDTLGAIYRCPALFADIGTSICDGSPNSTGSAATFRAFGVDLPAFNQVFLDVDNLPAFQWGLFLMSQNQTHFPLGNGFLCLGGPQVRLNSTLMNSWLQGAVGTQLDLNSLPPAASIQAGQSWNFQYWYRDAGSSNLSNALRIDF